MKTLIAILAVVLCTSACGGGGSKEDAEKPPVEAKMETGHSYLPHFSKRSTGLVVWEDEQHVEASRWRAGGGTVSWGDDNHPGHENFTIVRCSDGRRWMALPGFDQNPDGTPKWPILTVQQDVNGVALVCENNAPVHFPIDLPPDGTVWKLSQWFYIVGPERPGYWEATFRFGEAAYNPCWEGDGPKLRKVVWWSEAWWDAWQGWVDRGSSRDVPFVNGAPVRIDVQYDRHLAIAKDTGWFWKETRTDGKRQMCLKTATTIWEEPLE